MTAPVVRPGALLGVLGGGQLGRMFALAARAMGYSVAVYSSGRDTPAGQVASQVVDASFEDGVALERFARAVAAVTFEFENVPADAARICARHTLVRPAGELLFTTQDRVREKRALAALGLPIARFAALERPEDLGPALATAGPRGVLKSASSGYDGKGQARVHGAEGLERAWRELGGRPCVYEELIDFRCELSIVGARGADGRIALYEPMLNYHANHVLDVTVTPAPLEPALRAEVERIARAVLEGFDVVGVLCVELFLTRADQLLINELAPRPHNSGHVTIDAHATSQFEQQVRALCGLPLGAPDRLAPAAAMANLLGDLWQAGPPDWARALADPRVKLHLYGKRDPRPGRKLGHLSATAADPQTAEALVREARAAAVRVGVCGA